MQDQSWRALTTDAFERALVRGCGPFAYAMVAVTTALQQWGFLVGWTVFVGAVAVVRELLVRSEDRPGSGRANGPASEGRSRLSAEALVVVGWAVPGLVGLPLVAWWLPVVCLAAGVAAASPLVVRVRRDRGTAALVLLLGDGSPEARTDRLARLSDEQLCSLWRRTSRRSLRRALRPVAASYSLVRGAVLDELESRDPAAFASWLRDGRPGDPAPFLRRTSGGRPAAGAE